MSGEVLGLVPADRAQRDAVGGKGARLSELSRVDGVRVPPGFCVTTMAFRRVVADAPSVRAWLHRLARVSPDDVASVGTLSAEIRRIIERLVIPADLAGRIVQKLAQSDHQGGWAVRSSATAEDLPSASFAGLHDSYLNVVGAAAVLDHVSRCWASMFSERAVTYRLRNGVDHRGVEMAVVVQQMLSPDAAGVLFTADPVTSDRRVVSIEACFGLGEALVSGHVNADIYKVRGGDLVDKTVATKRLATSASPAGGTQSAAVKAGVSGAPALTDGQAVQLAQLGRRIESHFGHPQDLEWCLAGGDFQVIQSRPITTLFPIPEVEDQDLHIYLSVGHQQMMTDALKPMGLSVWQLTTRRPMAEAGGRLFVDITPTLASPVRRDALLEMMSRSDPMAADAVRSLLDRESAIAADPGPGAPIPPTGGKAAPIETDPEIVTELISRSEASLATLRRTIRTKSGTELFAFIRDDIRELRQLMAEPRSVQAIQAAMDTAWQLNERIQAWLGEANVADTLAQSAPNNVTAQMGLALLDVADVIRPHPEVIAFLRDVDDEHFLAALDTLPGGTRARDAIQGYLDRYGMRCVGEIDITRPRWNERPSTLVPLILDHVENFESGASQRLFEQRQRAASMKRQELRHRLRALPDGERKAAEVEQLIVRLRTFVGYREYPKYFMISRYFLYRQALLEEAEQLVRAGVLLDRDDACYLRFEELEDAVATGRVDTQLIRRRTESFTEYETLTPPRVLTSHGEALNGGCRRGDFPPGALVGLPVSGGTVEGRARVISNLVEADLHSDDILVTAYTDPSWSPAFVVIKGLLTEVGGMMTHGAVIAREYGLPAVVGVDRATELIKDGQRIRLNGSDGYVEILS